MPVTRIELSAPTMRLTAVERSQVPKLVADAEASDGVRALNDEAELDLRRDGARHWLARTPDGTLAGYAQYSPTFGTAQLVVHPDFRRHGLGRRLGDAVLAAGASGIWAFGDLPAAQALAGASGLQLTRKLLIMARPLGPAIAVNEPEGVRLRPFTEQDTDAFLAVNAAAFATHPEQGAFSLADLRARQAEPWWHPYGLIVAIDDTTGRLLGFHWTKRHDAHTGEVYVIGVHPDAHGRGLGKALLDAGLAHLTALGCDRVILYVEHDNPAVRLYERTGFVTTRADAQYGRPR